MNFRFDIINGIGRLHLEGDSLTREGFDEDLHFRLASRVRLKFEDELGNELLAFSSGPLTSSTDEFLSVCRLFFVS